MNNRKHLQLYLLSAFSAALFATAFAKPSLSGLAWFVLSPFFYVLARPQTSWQQGLASGAVFGMVFYSLLLSWFYTLYPLDWLGFGSLSSLVLLTLAILAVAAIKTIGILVFAVGMTIFRSKSSILRWFFLICGWLALEWVQGIFPGTAFTWGRLAISQAGSLPLIQTAAWWGSLGLSGLMAAVNGAIAFCFLIPSWRSRFFFGVAACCLFGGNWLYGCYHLAQPLPPARTITAAVVQGAYGSTSKMKVGAEEDILAEYCQLSQQVDGADIIIWPETAVPNLPITELAAICRQLDTAILVGDYEIQGDLVENALFLLEDGHSRKIYVKEKLVPFGEYLPLPSLLHWVYKDLIVLSPGQDNQATPWRYGKLGGMICFDSTFSQIARKQARSGAELLIVASNDSWFQHSAAIYQHNSQAVFRAVETGLTLLRSANAGISAIIDGRGKVWQQLTPGQSGTLIQQVPLAPSHTLYVRIGDVAGWLGAIFFGTGTIYSLANIIRRRRGFHGNSNQAQP